MNEGESTTFTCNVTGKGIKKVEWYKDKMRLPSTFYPSGGSYISDLQLTAVTVSQAGAFECRTTVVPTTFKGYQGKTGMLLVKGMDLALLFLSELFRLMNIFIVQLTNIKLMKYFTTIIEETIILFVIQMNILFK